MTLVEHARRELELIGEEPETIDWYARVIGEFASFGHSGGSAAVTTATLERLLRFKHLSPITDDPADWIHVADERLRPGSPREPLYQNRRCGTLFSYDGGKTYYDIDSRRIPGYSRLPRWLRQRPGWLPGFSGGYRLRKAKASEGV